MPFHNENKSVFFHFQTQKNNIFVFYKQKSVYRYKNIVYNLIVNKEGESPSGGIEKWEYLVGLRATRTEAFQSDVVFRCMY